MKKIALIIVSTIVFCSNVFAQLGTQWHYDIYGNPSAPQSKGHIMKEDVGEVILRYEN